MCPQHRCIAKLHAKHLLFGIFLLGILQFLWLSTDWLFQDDVTDDALHAEMAELLSDLRQESRNAFKEKHPWLAEKEWMGFQDDACDPSSHHVTEVARLQSSPRELLSQMSGHWQWEWVMGRVTKLWAEWLESGKILNTTLPTNRLRKRILVIPGFLSLTDFASPKVIREGGPLGELVTWSDLVAGLTLLGHDVTIDYSVLRASHLLRWFLCQCSGGCCLSGFDLVYTDYGGMGTIPVDVLQAIRYKLRVLDWFGTDAVFNDATYARDHGYSTGSAFSLYLQQYFTGYPVSTDNAFLGFVVPQSKSADILKKKNVGILYGKDVSYTLGKENYLRQLSRHFTVHATMARSRRRFPDDINVTNHGIMTPGDYTHLTSSAKVLIGLGHPLEGPSPVEALSRGTVFLNPEFTKSEDKDVLRGKPTIRQMSSQIPYLEEYVGPPHVFTFDVLNQSEAEDAIQKALSTNAPPFVPYEFTMAGYLERLHYYITHLDFCQPHPHPALTRARRVLVAEPGQSCAAKCKGEGLLCENSLFQEVNSEETFTGLGVNCRNVLHGADTIHPGYFATNQTCFLQDNKVLFSCRTTSYNNHRICPCRDFKRFQHALCKECDTGPR